MTAMSERPLYPPLPPRLTGRLAVSDRHILYYEECGNPDGVPVVVLHGGPGAGCNPTLRRFHDPERYRIVLFDQRGCGRSEPHADLEDNTTWDLVSDIEKLRLHLGIDTWQVFGGSWGSTLALAYARTHADRVSALVLRGVFFASLREIDWFYGPGTGTLFPEAYEDFLAPLDTADRERPVPGYYRLLTGDDAARRERAAQAWSRWEATTLSLRPDPARVAAFVEPRYAIAFARIECHYFMHDAFFAEGDGLAETLDRLPRVPTVIVNGRYDVVTPPLSAWRLHKALPGSKLVIVEDAGHAMTEPGLVDALVRATDRLAG